MKCFRTINISSSRICALSLSVYLLKAMDVDDIVRSPLLT